MSSTPQASVAGVPRCAITLQVNGQPRELDVEPRATLLDTLRERLALTGPKKGCDRGQCGACTVLLDGRRINSCLTLAVACDGARVTTAEGLGSPQSLHPVQAAFVEQDAFQCGYCTPGQVCATAALLQELREGRASAVTPDLGAPLQRLSDEEIRERLSGNLCRCGAYPNIVRAVRQLLDAGGTAAA